MILLERITYLITFFYDYLFNNFVDCKNEHIHKNDYAIPKVVVMQVLRR
jgi:hypothetical protein